MSLFDGIPLDYEEPQPVVAAAKSVDLSVLVRISKTSIGRDILVCTVSPAPQAAIKEARRLGLPLFTEKEIPMMRKLASASPEALPRLLDFHANGFEGSEIISYKAVS